MNSPVQSPLPPLYNAAIDAISAHRFGSYLRAASGDSAKALELYHWNSRVSAALYESLHIVEVALRNAVDRELSAWNRTQTDAAGNSRSADWLMDTPALIERLVRREKIAEAKEQARKHIRRRRLTHANRNPQPNHSDVLAQLTFGTWRFILQAPTGSRPDPGRVLMWRDVLPNAFPCMTRQPADVVADVVRIYEARNRVAHLEPMLDVQQVQEIRDSVERVLSDMSMLLSVWFQTQETITDVLRKHPDHSTP